MKWAMKNHIRVNFYLKKPVNNLEIGYVQQINVDNKNLEITLGDNKEKEEALINLKNIFGKEKKILYRNIELMSFEYSSAMIQTKSNTSFTTRLGYQILKKFKPEKIIMT